MPSDKSEKDGSKDKGGDRKSGKDGKGGRDQRGGKDEKGGKGQSSKQSAAEIRAEEYDAFVKACVTSHAAWLSAPLLTISPSISISIPHFATLLLLLLTLLLLLSPASWIPHIAAPITLLIPLQNTLRCIGAAHDKRKGGSGGSGDVVQWVIIWIGWVGLGWVGEMVRCFRPGWRGVWEIGRVGAGIVLAGPWFGKAALVPGKPSSKLAEAEKREAGEAAKAEQASKKGDPSKKDGKWEAKDEDKAKADAKKRAERKAKAKKEQKEDGA
ncbi:uncharacterized protein MKK02DRAFT_38740 [Dioszegia hungarica]|uniref:Uncharacterized protein n=1 Tax=Dioszegia hungarica TaxID=4972 RepID=A0AA38H775_9TREE|nr:uncharacterized protein MKK02DRAFT_38740 [Dioszegia hungarica]KAI9634069.1 hypothetical protein MKK02DRAFT_38740 [Dioszegia hungarica]